MDAQQNEQQKRSRPVFQFWDGDRFRDIAPEEVRVVLFDQDYIDPWALSQWPRLEPRLRALGMYEHEIGDMKQQWVHDATWPHHEKVAVLGLGDAKLRGEIERVRMENRTDRETEAQQVLRETNEANEAADAALLAEAERASAYGVDTILQWVGGDLTRARASLAIEEAHPAPRADVLASLLAVIERERRV